MKLSLCIFTLTFSINALASTYDLNWMQGYWTGWEKDVFHEKTISSASGGKVIGAAKMFKNDELWVYDFFEIDMDGSKISNLVFYNTNGVKARATCQLEAKKAICQNEAGTFKNVIEFIQGESRQDDIMRMTKTWMDTTNTFDLKRGE